MLTYVKDKYNDLHEYSMYLIPKTLVTIVDSIAKQIENDLKAWEGNLK